jgi:hypothetical protein
VLWGNERGRSFRKVREVWLFMNPGYGFLVWRNGLRFMCMMGCRVASNSMPGIVRLMLGMGYV